MRGYGLRMPVASSTIRIERKPRTTQTNDEDRFIVVGRVGAVVLVVVYTERNGVERIISARKAEPREERAYYARFR